LAPSYGAEQGSIKENPNSKSFTPERITERIDGGSIGSMDPWLCVEPWTSLDGMPRVEPVTINRIERLAIVEAGEGLAARLIDVLRSRATQSLAVGDVRAVRTVKDARATMHDWKPDFLLVDFELPDGDAFDVVGYAKGLDALPTIVVMARNEARPEETYLFRDHGIRAYLPKPFGPRGLVAAIQAAQKPRSLEIIIRGEVGQQKMDAVVTTAKTVMLEEALARSGYKKSLAAASLGITPQRLAYLLRTKTLPPRRRREKLG